MGIQALKFNVENLRPLIKAGQSVTVKDTEVKSLRFVVRKTGCSFVNEKRVSGQKGAALSFTMKAVVEKSGAVNYREARDWARELNAICAAGGDPREDTRGRELLGLPPLPDASSSADTGTEEPVEPKELLLKDAMVLFLQKKSHLKARTLKMYVDVMNHGFLPEWHDRDLRTLTVPVVMARFLDVYARSRKLAWDFLKLYSNIWNTNRIWFTDHDGRKILDVCCTKDVRESLRRDHNIKRHKPKRAVVKIHDLGKLLFVLEQIIAGRILLPDQKPGDPVLPSVLRTAQLSLLCLFTGLRFTEARFLKWEYVHLKEGYLVLPGALRQKAFSEEESNVFVFDTEGKVKLNYAPHAFDFNGTKNGEMHVVPFSSAVQEVLTAMYREHTTNPYVFAGTARKDRPIRRHDRVFQLIRDQAGCYCSPHAFRRTLASVANDVGIGYEDIKEMLNHVAERDVTSGYIVKGFNPGKNRVNFQKVCDFILDRHAEHVGASAREQEDFSRVQAVQKLRRMVVSLGFSHEEALMELAKVVPVPEVAA